MRDDLLAFPGKMIGPGEGECRQHAVPNYDTDIAELTNRLGARVSQGRFPDGVEVISLYDANDGNFGYAVNLSCDWCSEWGYAPFGDPDADDEQT